jgi:hypothetical protein
MKNIELNSNHNHQVYLNYFNREKFRYSFTGILREILKRRILKFSLWITLKRILKCNFMRKNKQSLKRPENLSYFLYNKAKKKIDKEFDVRYLLKRI